MTRAGLNMLAVGDLLDGAYPVYVVTRIYAHDVAIKNIYSLFQYSWTKPQIRNHFEYAKLERWINQYGDGDRLLRAIESGKVADFGHERLSRD